METPKNYKDAINTVISQCELWTDYASENEENEYTFVNEEQFGMVAEKCQSYKKM